MRENFLKCLPVILKYEGGYSNHPRDPGGVTLEGIIQRVYDGYRDRKGKSRQILTAGMRSTPAWIAERSDIYRLQYWNAIKGDELPAGIDLFVFDCAVNSGPYQAIKWLQRALGMTDVDGHLGEGTLAALMVTADHDAVVADMASRRLGMLKNLTTWDAFGAGWSARVSSAKSIAQAWAVGSVGPAPVEAYQQRGDAKAYASDVAQPFMDADSATKGAVGGGSIAGLVQGAQAQLQPFLGASDWLTNIYMVLTVAGVVIAVGGVVYSFWASQKSKTAQRAIDGSVMAQVPEGQPEGQPA